MNNPLSENLESPGSGSINDFFSVDGLNNKADILQI
jgi:hypothetical protein